MVPPRLLTSITGAFAAQVVAARLRSEGIDVLLRGAVSSPYGLTVGDMARVDLYVADDQLDDARLALLAGEIDSVLAAPREWGGDDGPRARRWPTWIALAGVVGTALIPLVHWLRA